MHYDSWVQGNSSGQWASQPDKLLIHTTEGGSISGAVGAYVANNSWPHLTVDCRFGRDYHIQGHLSFDVPARALRNTSGGVETNRDGVIQIEVVGSAVSPGAIDWQWFGENVAGPICAEENIPVSSTVVWVAYPASYGLSAPQRLSYGEWTAYRGLLGHQHAPENTHGDPGAIPISVILAATVGQIPVPPIPIPPEDLMPYPVVRSGGGSPERPNTALLEGYVVKFTPSEVAVGPQEVWAPSAEYHSGVIAGLYKAVVSTDDANYDRAVASAKRLEKPS